MPKFDIAAIISAVRSPLQFASLLAILIFLSFLVLRFGPNQRPVPTCEGQTCSARDEESQLAAKVSSHWNTATGCIKLQLGD